MNEDVDSGTLVQTVGTARRWLLETVVLAASSGLQPGDLRLSDMPDQVRTPFLRFRNYLEAVALVMAAEQGREESVLSLMADHMRREFMTAAAAKVLDSPWNPAQPKAHPPSDTAASGDEERPGLEKLAEAITVVAQTKEAFEYGRGNR